MVLKPRQRLVFSRGGKFRPRLHQPCADRGGSTAWRGVPPGPKAGRTWDFGGFVMGTRLLIACFAALALVAYASSNAGAKADDKGDTHSGLVGRAEYGQMT